VFHIYRRKADHICCIRLILEEKWEHSERVHQIFVDLKKSYDSIRREVLNHIPIEFVIAMKLFMLIKTCLYNCWLFNDSVCPVYQFLITPGGVCGYCHIKLSEFRFESLQVSFLT
jgi:hypothetical protein